MKHEYECPKCYELITGDIFDLEVTCKSCNIKYETDWDYTSMDNIGSWIVK